jgi:hypothetical protein
VIFGMLIPDPSLPSLIAKDQFQIFSLFLIFHLERSSDRKCGGREREIERERDFQKIIFHNIFIII